MWWPHFAFFADFAFPPPLSPLPQIGGCLHLGRYALQGPSARLEGQPSMWRFHGWLVQPVNETRLRRVGCSEVGMSEAAGRARRSRETD